MNVCFCDFIGFPFRLGAYLFIFHLVSHLFSPNLFLLFFSLWFLSYFNHCSVVPSNNFITLLWYNDICRFFGHIFIYFYVFFRFDWEMHKNYCVDSASRHPILNQTSNVYKTPYTNLPRRKMVDDGCKWVFVATELLIAGFFYFVCIFTSDKW